MRTMRMDGMIHGECFSDSVLIYVSTPTDKYIGKLVVSPEQILEAINGLCKLENFKDNVITEAIYWSLVTGQWLRDESTYIIVGDYTEAATKHVELYNRVYHPESNVEESLLYVE